ncbi:MAG: bifunctional UDP-3-O-[3-hydroxymyristoyl] N-acetylglucosamine deacetylase/3-hydroxyacyl-ACP dehydratase [Candidatus Kapabacteria bacterium]|nr:bifunctional UDP-3-O-[3-hydroxymyristoyl] N-acetylglucosamine deacetylase/3-hydroxyacyl-ACP dehydratase [Ignavibacteriota bacterium]MCW5885948.1 bifunctional UDP-3-O-[3-hydroxymyristoyl] N-acetylglucosamine deacetylase/3-hydroxyacyl-ACP dehydratase [Candidatus Kapabacteria bacterium]
MEKQRTIARAVSFSGTGLHTGNPSTITFNPAPANYGYVFIRTDIEPNFEVPALIENVVDLSRGTTLGIGDIHVHTVEHVLAALVGLKIDNCRIELSANEPPVVDGSSMPYVNALISAGVHDQDAEREYFIVDETLRYTNEDKHVDIVALPNPEYRITVMIDYFNPALGSQHTGMFDLEKEFVTEFAPARTFCFLTEVMELHKQGLIKGGSLDSAIVINDAQISDEQLLELKEVFKLNKPPIRGNNGILNGEELRFKNEPARHKLLDMIGDLALVGVPIKAQILAARPGHASNIEFGKKIRKLYLEKKKIQRVLPSKNQTTLMDIHQILDIMPHRYPFLLIDRVTSFDEENEILIAYKNVSINEPYFNGHFPGKPVMPGVLILEALAQTGGLLLFKRFPEVYGKLAFFMGIKNAKFRKPVFPGDQLIMEVKLVSKRFNTYLFDSKAYVDGSLVTESEFQAAIVER